MTSHDINTDYLVGNSDTVVCDECDHWDTSVTMDGSQKAW